MIAWLLDTLVYTGLLIGLVLALRRPFGRWFGPQVAYALWALPFLRLLLPPIVLPASLAPEPATLDAAPLAEMPATAPAPPATGFPIESVATLPDAAFSSAPAWAWSDLAAPVVSIWAGVAIAFLAWRVVTYRRMRRDLLQDARPVGEISRIRLIETPALTAPVAFGVLDKVIALPPRFMAQPDLVARDLAIEHELGHHNGRDLLANFAAQALLALHWFNPLAWLGWRAMRRDQEAACDARVIAGRSHEDRLRYASLIAGVATGPRLALAAPMACPVLGERSIVHRLRSLSMSEKSRRRRNLGRALVGAGALALPLTASISYAAVQAVEAPAVAAAPDSPEAHAAAAPNADGREIRAIVVRQDGSDAAEPGEVRRFALQRGDLPPVPPTPPAPPAPAAPPIPAFDFPDFDPSDPAFEASMERFERDMEQWSRRMEDWGEKWGEQYAARMEAHALAAAEVARNAPEVIESCDPAERRRATTADGRPRVVICEREIRARAEAGALASLRGARASIAHNGQIGADVQRGILAELDEEIARIERGGN